MWTIPSHCTLNLGWTLAKSSRRGEFYFDFLFLFFNFLIFIYEFFNFFFVEINFSPFFIKICHKKIWHLPKPFLGVDENWKKKKKIQKCFMIIFCLLNRTINFAKLFYFSICYLCFFLNNIKCILNSQISKTNKNFPKKVYKGQSNAI